MSPPRSHHEASLKTPSDRQEVRFRTKYTFIIGHGHRRNKDQPHSHGSSTGSQKCVEKTVFLTLTNEQSTGRSLVCRRLKFAPERHLGSDWLIEWRQRKSTPASGTKTSVMVLRNKPSGTLQDSLFPSFILSRMCDGVRTTLTAVKGKLTRNYQTVSCSLCTSWSLYLSICWFI